MVVIRVMVQDMLSFSNRLEQADVMADINEEKKAGCSRKEWC